MVRTFFATLALLAFYSFLAAYAFASVPDSGPSMLGVEMAAVATVPAPAASPAPRPRPRISLEAPTSSAPPPPPPAPTAAPREPPAPLSLVDRIKQWFGRLVGWLPEMLADLNKWKERLFGAGGAK